VHWIIKGRWSQETRFCGGTNNAKGCKRKECCCKGRIIINRSVVGSTTSHTGAYDGRSTTKGNGDGLTWNGSYNEEKMHNLG
jgi:hypothetical protein